MVVFFDGKVYWLADGFHRWWASRKAGRKTILCEVRNGTQQDAQWYSYSANATHGLHRSNADKRKAVKSALLHPNGAKMSDVQIAEHVAVSPNTVLKYRAEMETTSQIAKSPTRTGRDGRTIDTTNIGKRGQSEPTPLPFGFIPETGTALVGLDHEKKLILVVASESKQHPGYWLVSALGGRVTIPGGQCEVDLVAYKRPIAEDWLTDSLGIVMEESELEPENLDWQVVDCSIVAELQSLSEDDAAFVAGAA